MSPEASVGKTLWLITEPSKQRCQHVGGKLNMNKDETGVG